DDHNDCTVDRCDAQVGCTSAAAPNGSVCSASGGSGVCRYAACVRTAMAGGYNSTCALATDGSIHCFGDTTTDGVGSAPPAVGAHYKEVALRY
ncbi:hypothetical protein ABTE52_19975, partial [Acinetobacter baumannii]